MAEKPIYIRKMPEELWNQVKALAALRGQTVEEFVISTLRAAIRDFSRAVDKYAPPPEKEE